MAAHLRKCYLQVPTVKEFEMCFIFAAAPYQMNLTQEDRSLLVACPFHSDFTYRTSAGWWWLEIYSGEGFQAIIRHLVNQADAYREEHGDDDRSLNLAITLLESIGIEWI